MKPYRIICIGYLTICGFSCSDSSDEVTPPPIGHTLNLQETFHGIGHFYPNRYCTSCHGIKLTGGDSLEPSCLSCHGKNWLDEVESPTRAPSSHQIELGGYLHNSGYDQPLDHCTSCHGLDLQGESSGAIPSCYLCHEKNWS